GFELAENVGLALDVHEHVVGLGEVLDRIGELAAAPVFEAVDLALGVALDQRLVTLDHRGHLLALVRVGQKHDLVVTDGVSLWVPGRTDFRPGSLPRRGEARSFAGFSRTKGREY